MKSSARKHSGIRTIASACALLLLFTSSFLLQGCKETVTAESEKKPEVSGKYEYKPEDFSPVTEWDVGTDEIAAVLGSYSGVFVEQGTDMPCENIYALMLRNNTARMMERVSVSCCGAEFVATYLPAGEMCLVQEKNGMPADVPLTGNPVLSETVSYLDSSGLHEDQIHITAEQGAVIMENISGKDIPGSVNVWYKTFSDGVYFGGVSYRAAVDDGVLTAGARAEIQTGHYKQNASKIILVSFSD